MLAHRHDLFTMIYHSAARPGLSSIDLDEILTASRVRNRDASITGMLLAENGRFLQALEGPEDRVRGLMDRIGEDPRHEHVRILVEQSIDRRRFPDWAMAHGHVGEIETMPLADYVAALQDARGELPPPQTRLEQLRDWFRG